MRVSARAVAAIGAIALLLGNVGRIPGGALGGRTAPVVAADLVVVLVWGVLLLSLGARGGRLVMDDVMGAAVAFVAAAALSTAFAFSRYNIGIVEGVGVVGFLVRWVAYFGWYPFVVWCLTPDESRLAWRDIEWAILAFATFGILQSAFLPGFAQLIHDSSDVPTWDIQGRRLVSTLLDPNFAGIVIVIALLFQLARAAEGIRVSPFPLVLLGGAALLTVSRSALLGLGVGVATIVVTRGIRRRLLIVLGAGAVLIVPAIPVLAAFAANYNKLRYDMSAAQRLVPWTRAARLVAEHPWFGVGFNAIKQAQESHGWRSIGGADVSLDGGLLFVAAMTGFVGLALYLRMVWRMSGGARRIWRDSTAALDDRAHATATVAATMAVIAHSFFVNSLLLPFVMQIVWVMWGRLAHLRARRRARLGLAAAVPFALAAAGCDPCAGTVACSTDPRISLSGTIVDHSTGAGVPGAHVDIKLAGGSASVSAVTRDDGVWEASIPATSQQAARANITVTSPKGSSYTVNGVAVTPTTRAGDATLLGLWSDIPQARHLATLVHASVPLAGAQVHFTPSSAPGLISAQADASTNGAGIFELDFAGQQLTQIVGTLTVSHPSLTHTAVLPGYVIPLDYHFGIPSPRSTIPVGAQLAYGGEVVFRGNDKKVGGVGVDFVRTGGIATTPDHVTTTTNDDGFFRIDLTPLTDGDVIGDLTLRPPSGSPAVYKNVHFATYDSLSIRTSGVWAFGERWSWAVELWRNDSLKPAPGVGVLFLRTGGIATSADTISGLTTGADGRVELHASVQDAGFVDGNIIAFPKTGPPRFVTAVHLRTNPDDQLHLAGVFGFGPSLRYVGEVLTPDGTAVVGAQVQWTQTAGIAATPPVLNSVVDANGRFSLLLYPSIDGVAIGQVRVRPPAPWAPGTEFVFPNLQLPTFVSGDLKLAVTYRIPRP